MQNKKQKIKFISKLLHVFLLSTIVLGSFFGFFYGLNNVSAATCDDAFVNTWPSKTQVKMDRKTAFVEEDVTAYILISLTQEEIDACKVVKPSPRARFYLYFSSGAGNYYQLQQLNQHYVGVSLQYTSKGLEAKTILNGNYLIGPGLLPDPNICEDLNCAKTPYDRPDEQILSNPANLERWKNFQGVVNAWYAYIYPGGDNGGDPSPKSSNYVGYAPPTPGKQINLRFKVTGDGDHRVPADGDTDIPTDIDTTGGSTPGQSAGYKTEDLGNTGLSIPNSIYRYSLDKSSTKYRSVKVSSTVSWNGGSAATPLKEPAPGDKIKTVKAGVYEDEVNDVGTIGGFSMAANMYYEKIPDNCDQYDKSVWGDTVTWYNIVFATTLGIFNVSKNLTDHLLAKNGCPNLVSRSEDTDKFSSIYTNSFTTAKLDSLFTDASTKAVKPGEVSMVMYPIISMTDWSVRDLALVQGSENAKITIKGFKDDAALLADCKTEHPDYFDGDKLKDGKDCSVGGSAISATVSSNKSSTPDACQSNQLACFLKDIIVFIISLLREIIYTIFFYIVLPLLQAVLSIRTYTDTFASVIYPGWVIIRNLCNIFLILAMLVIGLATMFRVDGYNYKQLLVKVILAALFVNFSLVFGQAVLGIADTAQNQFLPVATDPLNQLGSALMVGNTAGGWPSMGENPSAYADIVFSIFQLALAIGSFIAFVAITVLLVVRMMALWILLMVSPVAWVADVLPATSKYRGEWWSNFLKYAFFSPIMGFFLNLTAVISLTLHQKLKDITGASFQNSVNGSGELSNFIFQIATNVLLIAFLVAAVMVAQSFGIKGADMAVSAVSKGLKSPFGAIAWAGKTAGSRGLSTVGRKYNEWTVDKIRGHDVTNVPLGRRLLFAAAHPFATYKGYQKRTEEMEHEAKEKVVLSAQEGVERVMDKREVPRLATFEQAEIEAASKDYMAKSREEGAKQLGDALLLPNTARNFKFKFGRLHGTSSEGYIDDAIADDINADFLKEGPEKDTRKIDALRANLEGLKHSVIDEEGNHVHIDDSEVFNDDGTLRNNHYGRALVMLTLMGGHVSDIAAEATQKFMNKDGIDTNHHEYRGLFVKNLHAKPGENQWAIRSESNSHKYIASELAKATSRVQAPVAPHVVMDIDADKLTEKSGDLYYDGGLYTDEYRTLVKAWTENPTFSQERTANWLIGGVGLSGEKKDRIIQTYKDTGQLEINETTWRRIQAMNRIDSKGFVAMYSRFMNDAKPQAIDALLAKGEVNLGKDSQGKDRIVKFKLTAEEKEQLKSKVKKESEKKESEK